MTYEKGHTAWNRGRTGLQSAWNKGMAREQQELYRMKKKQREQLKGIRGFPKNHIPWNKGLKVTELPQYESYRQKLSESMQRRLKQAQQPEPEPEPQGFLAKIGAFFRGD